MKAGIRMEMRLPVLIVKKEKWYVSSCPILDVFSQGDTQQEAKKNIIEALSLFLTSCYEHGTLEAVLQQCGFKKAMVGAPVKYKGQRIDKAEYVKIPLYLTASNAGQTHCHA